MIIIDKDEPQNCYLLKELSFSDNYRRTLQHYKIDKFLQIFFTYIYKVVL